MTVSGPCCDKLDQTLRGDDALDASQIVAKFVVAGDSHRLALEGLFGTAEQLALARVGEVDGLQLVVA